MSETDVSKCGYFLYNECIIVGYGTNDQNTFCRLCKDNPNCHYKQLQQLKQENEELKQEILELKDYWENKE